MLSSRCIIGSKKHAKTLLTRNFQNLSIKNELSSALKRANQMFTGYSPADINSFKIKENASVVELISKAKTCFKEIGHPSYELFRILFDNKIPVNTTILLLICRAMSIKHVKITGKTGEVTGLLESQHTIIDAFENMYIGINMHKNICVPKDPTPNKKIILKCNTIGQLIGFYIIFKSAETVCQLREPEITEIFHSVLRDYIEGEFVGKNRGFQAVPSKPKPVRDLIYKGFENPGTNPVETEKYLGFAASEWFVRNLLGNVSFLAKSGQCCAKLAGHDVQTQKCAYIIGRNVALMRQLSLEMDEINNEEKFSLISAPVLFHLEHDNSFYKYFENEQLDFDYGSIKKLVLGGPGIERALLLKKSFLRETVQSLNYLPVNKYSNMLYELVNLI